MITKRINYLLISIFSIIIFVFGFFFIKNMNTSYAYEPNTPTYPTGTFTTNYNRNPVNYIKTALTANSVNSPLSDNFSVPDILKVAPNGNILYVLQKNLEVPGTQEKIELLSDNNKKINDVGVEYIISHGYNTSNNLNHIFSDSGQYGSANVNQKYYVTQIALWLYLYEKESSFPEICANNACKFYTNSNGTTNASDVRKVINDCSGYNGYKYLKYIITLVDGAKSYRGNTEQSKIASSNSGSTTFTIDSNTLTTSLVSPVVTGNANNFTHYSFEVEDPDNLGVYLTDNSGTRLALNTIYKEGLAFKINVPLPSNLSQVNLKNVKVKVNGHFMLDTLLNYYRVTDSPDGTLLPTADKTQRFSNVLFAYAQDDVAEIQFNLHNFVMISKVDARDGKLVSGAKLKIVDKNDEENTTEFTSGSKASDFHLANGEYKLCEVEAPNGYKLNESCVDFSVDGNHIVVVKMENQPIVDVPTPDTGAFKGYMKYVFGFILICMGLGVFIVSYKRQINPEESN